MAIAKDAVGKFSAKAKDASQAQSQPGGGCLIRCPADQVRTNLQKALVVIGLRNVGNVPRRTRRKSCP